MSEISDLSWNHCSFWSKFKLVCVTEYQARLKIKCLLMKANALSDLSSTYYSVAGTSGKQIKRILWDQPQTIPGAMMLTFNIWMVPLWCFLGCYCFLKALPTSDQSLEAYKGYQFLTADKCDIRQSILRSRGWLEEALVCINWGVSKKPSKHCMALLLVGRIDIFLRRRSHRVCLKEIEAWIDQAVALAKDSEEKEPLQASRIYRHCDFFYRKIKKQKNYLKKAERLAREAGSKDQLLKIQG